MNELSRQKLPIYISTSRFLYTACKIQYTCTQGYIKGAMIENMSTGPDGAVANI